MKKNLQINSTDEKSNLLNKIEKISTENLMLFLNLNVLEKYCKQTFDLYASLFTSGKKWVYTIALLLSTSVFIQAQENVATAKPIVAVLSIDTKGINDSPEQISSMVRIEVEKLGLYQMMDIYDVNYTIEKNKINVANCYGKICQVEVGKLLKADKMFTGSAEHIGKNIIITFRLIDVASGSIEKSQVEEFLYLPSDMQNMVKITISKMYGREIPKANAEKSLTEKNAYEDAINNPEQTKVNLSGPRMGFAYFTGEAGKVLQMPRSKGGYNSYPCLFQFGYQFEVQYLNEGNNQALFEFLPMVTGFNQNIFIPSLTIMNGLRNNKWGLEIAFGPTFGIVKKAEGFYDANGDWHLKYDPTYVNPDPLNTEYVKRLDSRGDFEAQFGFIVAVGKTFKSGRLNIPVNGYIIPNKDGVKVGVSFGFNAKRR